MGSQVGQKQQQSQQTQQHGSASAHKARMQMTFRETAETGGAYGAGGLSGNRVTTRGNGLRRWGSQGEEGLRGFDEEGDVVSCTEDACDGSCVGGIIHVEDEFYDDEGDYDDGDDVDTVDAQEDYDEDDDVDITADDEVESEFDDADDVGEESDLSQVDPNHHHRHPQQHHQQQQQQQQHHQSHQEGEHQHLHHYHQQQQQQQQLQQYQQQYQQQQQPQQQPQQQQQQGLQPQRYNDPQFQLDQTQGAASASAAVDDAAGAAHQASSDSPVDYIWDDSTEFRLEELLLEKLDSLHSEAVVKVASFGYTDEAARQAVDRFGSCFGEKDALTNIVSNALLFGRGPEITAMAAGRTGRGSGSRTHTSSFGTGSSFGTRHASGSGTGQASGGSPSLGFSTRRELQQDGLSRMLCALQAVWGPQMSRGDAMWCLLMSDLDLRKACELDLQPPPRMASAPPAAAGRGNAGGGAAAAGAGGAAAGGAAGAAGAKAAVASTQLSLKASAGAAAAAARGAGGAGGTGGGGAGGAGQLAVAGGEAAAASAAEGGGAAPEAAHTPVVPVSAAPSKPLSQSRGKQALRASLQPQPPPSSNTAAAAAAAAACVHCCSVWRICRCRCGCGCGVQCPLPSTQCACCSCSQRFC
ncbi:hypothetical protein CLOM_g2300 [Closterium sp. NIES-68]|nr:hypothetical protein CLOM_g2300 [Closterium sp. NIES-68]